MFLASLAVAALASPGTPPVDLRSVELLRESCASRIGSRDLTLFGNGTVRLREGLAGETSMQLGELGAPELEAFRRRLAEIDFEATEVVARGPEGDWLDRCRLAVELEPGADHELEYGRFDSGSLELEKLRRILEDLIAVARTSGASGAIPASYEPRLGDRLRRADGAIFEVVGFTLDGRGVELISDDPPLTLFVDRENLRTLFESLVSEAMVP